MAEPSVAYGGVGDEDSNSASGTRPTGRRLPLAPGEGGIMELGEALELARAGRCEELPRPCPLVSCRHNLYLDVDPETGELEVAHPSIEPHKVDPHTSCAVDVAMRGGQEAEFVADLLGMGPVAYAVLEEGVKPVLRQLLQGFEHHNAQEREDPATPLGDLASTTQGGLEKGLEEWEDDRSGRVVADRLKVEILTREGAVGKGEVTGRRARKLGEPLPQETAWGFPPLDPNDQFTEEYGRAVFKVYERSSRFRHEDAQRLYTEAELERRGDAAKQDLPEGALDSLFEDEEPSEGGNTGGP